MPNKRTTVCDLDELVEQHRQLLIEGIRIRQNLVKTMTNPVERDQVEAQIKNWKRELDDFSGRGLANHLNLVRQRLETDREARRVDIICLKYKSEDVELRCLKCLLDYTDWPYKLTWYDSRNQTANFSKLWNHLVSVSTCDYVCIMDSDAYVTRRWLSRMMSSFESGFECKPNRVAKPNWLCRPDRVGLVVPVTRKGGAHTLQGESYTDKTPFLTNAQVSGYFMLFNRQMWLELGGFDERFYLHGQDSEWVDRIIASDWQIVVRPDVFVDHEVSASIKKAVKEGEINYPVDLTYTQLVYELIREEKERKLYEPPRYPSLDSWR